jgi:hypothetical protein
MVAYLFYTSNMKPAHETYLKIRQRLLRECEGVKCEREELEVLAPQYFRYIDGKKRAKEHWKRILYIVRLIGPARTAKIIQSDKTGILQELAANPAESNDANAKLSLWKAMREYLREEGSSRVGDIQTFLLAVDYKHVTRQSIESAIKRHPETFTSRTSRHERVVSLRENEEGESSSDEE